MPLEWNVNTIDASRLHVKMYSKALKRGTETQLVNKIRRCKQRKVSSWLVRLINICVCVCRNYFQIEFINKGTKWIKKNKWKNYS